MTMKGGATNRCKECEDKGMGGEDVGGEIKVGCVSGQVVVCVRSAVVREGLQVGSDEGRSVVTRCNRRL